MHPLSKQSRNDLHNSMTGTQEMISHLIDPITGKVRKMPRKVDVLCGVTGREWMRFLGYWLYFFKCSVS